ncbi:hypothetical protein AFLA70_57g003642 [Aspergillus flavus AF70]|nr:hypothetical protein AFLA70_57g003642 [Aspergillus flavus AF70]
MTCAHWCTTYVIGRHTYSLLSCLVSSTSALGRVAGLPWWRLHSRRLEEVRPAVVVEQRLWLEFSAGSEFSFDQTLTLSCFSI